MVNATARNLRMPLVEHVSEVHCGKEFRHALGVGAPPVRSVVIQCRTG
jgi:hypothetical protein